MAEPETGVRSALVVGRAIDPVRELAAHLGGELAAVPELAPSADPARWDEGWIEPVGAWGRELRDGPPVPHVVVCTWRPDYAPQALVERAPADWSASVERELGLWFEASVAAARRCSDGGSLVLLVERPAALDAPGHGDAVVVAEGLATLARSLGINEGGRGVRVNLVTTELWTAPEQMLGLPPLLASFPGRVGVEAAGAVRALWSDDAVGISGTVVRADGGRSW